MPARPTYDLAEHARKETSASFQSDRLISWRAPFSLRVLWHLKISGALRSFLRHDDQVAESQRH